MHDEFQRVEFVIKSTEDPLRDDGPNVIANLIRSPKKVSSLYVYDREGTELFERQCRTPEYYLRRVELRLLRRHAGDVTALCGFVPIVELGAGTADKTRLLFAEYASRGLRCDYFPIDVDTQTLAETAARLVGSFPGLFVHCLGTTFEKGLRALRGWPQRRLFLFLGSSIGNMDWEEIDRLLADLFSNSAKGDFLLLGADLDKAPVVINEAYNDSAGYGPRSTLNILSHLNHRYDGNFKLAQFRYRSAYDPLVRKNEVWIESLMDQTVTLAALDFTVSFTGSERIDAEVMWKFDPNELCTRLQRAGFWMVRQWIDPLFHYGLFLLHRR